jgi:short-subunit dehydrogenase involved in D-alanine esterification of teichoic acids
MTVREVAEKARISKTTRHEIRTENLSTQHVTAKFVPCLLNEDQKQNCVDVSKQLVNRENADENFLKNIVSGDETWVYG